MLLIRDVSFSRRNYSMKDTCVSCQVEAKRYIDTGAVCGGWKVGGLTEFCVCEYRQKHVQHMPYSKLTGFNKLTF